MACKPWRTVVRRRAGILWPVGEAGTGATCNAGTGATCDLCTRVGRRVACKPWCTVLRRRVASRRGRAGPLWPVAGEAGTGRDRRDSRLVRRLVRPVSSRGRGASAAQEAAWPRLATPRCCPGSSLALVKPARLAISGLFSTSRHAVVEDLECLQAHRAHLELRRRATRACRACLADAADERRGR